MVQEADELKHLPAPILPSEAEVEAHNVSHLPFRSWCSACVRGRGPSLGLRRVVAKKKGGRTDTDCLCGILGSLGNRKTEHMTHSQYLLTVRDRMSRGIWSHPVPSSRVTHPYLARALMADLDFMGYRIVILKPDQELSIVALCDAVKNG